MAARALAERDGWAAVIQGRDTALVHQSSEHDLDAFDVVVLDQVSLPMPFFRLAGVKVRSTG